MIRTTIPANEIVHKKNTQLRFTPANREERPKD